MTYRYILGKFHEAIEILIEFKQFSSFHLLMLLFSFCAQETELFWHPRMLLFKMLIVGFAVQQLNFNRRGKNY